MKLMKCLIISDTNEILSGWFMLWKRILKMLSALILVNEPIKH